MAFRPTTPFQLHGELITPGAPRYGTFEDEWSPSGKIRKSPRISSQRSQLGATTPPPQASSFDLHDHHSAQASSLPRRTPVKGNNSRSLDLTPSEKIVPRSVLARDSRRASAARREENSKFVTTSLHTSTPRSTSRMASNLPVPIEPKNSMLPTPVKTPKKVVEKSNAELSSISRNLFDVRPDSTGEAIPTVKARGTFSHEFDVEEEAPIAIYTDSKERVPELDLHPDNVFIDRPYVAPPGAAKKSKVTMVKIPGEGEVTVEEAVKRRDGVVYNFRGKYVFKFLPEAQDDSEPTGAEMDASISEGLDAIVPARLRGPLTRSSLKPKLLFPTEQSAAGDSEHAVSEEEVVTDVDERAKMVCTPTREMGKPVSTPNAPRFGPFVSPPTTVRTRRSHKVDEFNTSNSSPDMSMGCDGAGDERPSKGQSGSLSPFDAWRRTKARHGGPSRKKRTGEELKKGTAEGSKRLRRGSRGSSHAEAA